MSINKVGQQHKKIRYWGIRGIILRVLMVFTELVHREVMIGWIGAGWREEGRHLREHSKWFLFAGRLAAMRSNVSPGGVDAGPAEFVPW